MKGTRHKNARFCPCALGLEPYASLALDYWIWYRIMEGLES
jgi:hypothetical protein